MVARVAIVLGTLAAAAAAPAAAGTPTCDVALRSVQCPGSAASHPACWDGAYTFERCCANPPSGDPTCWDGVNTFASCCTPSEQGCAVCAGHNQQALRNAGCTHEDIVGFCAGDAAPIAPTVEIAPGVAMPRINLGTCCGSEVTNAFPAWWAAGGRGVDTAYDYGKEVPGGKETDLRKAIDRVGAPRESLFITTKIRAGLDVLHGGKLCIGLNADYALAGVRADLAELNVSQVDLVLLHAPCLEDGTNAELWRGMEQALALNLTRAIGVSNYPKAQLGTLLETARVKPAVNQCQMSMANQEAEMVRYCKEHGAPPENRRL
jgi:diketogulonate reductase-like aldo/keto reductase